MGQGWLGKNVIDRPSPLPFAVQAARIPDYAPSVAPEAGLHFLFQPVEQALRSRLNKTEVITHPVVEKLNVDQARVAVVIGQLGQRLVGELKSPRDFIRLLVAQHL